MSRDERKLRRDLCDLVKEADNPENMKGEPEKKLKRRVLRSNLKMT